MASGKTNKTSASKAAKARWNSTATHAGSLGFGEIEIPCYVLGDGRRVLSQAGMVSALAMSPGGNVKLPNAPRLVRFLESRGIQPHVPAAVLARTREPIRFRTDKNQAALGYEAMLLADICEAVTAARREGTLHPQQRHIAERCDLLVRGMFRVGIVALVDEATGYQVDRARNALADILESFISKELGRWAKRFPDEYYEQLYRLRKLERDVSARKPMYLGHITNNIVYRRLAPGVLDELRRVNPKKGRRRTAKHHQWLTEEVGHPGLQTHLTQVITLMKISTSYEQFLVLLNQVAPEWGHNYEFVFDSAADFELDEAN